MMKGFYRLVNREFAKWLWFIAAVCAAAIVVPLVLLHKELRPYNEYWVNERYEDVYASSGSILLFLVLLALVCAFFLLTIYADYWGSKSIYTYLTLPVGREALYLSKLTVLVTCLLLLLASQLIGIRLGYSLYAAKVASYGDGQFVMHNGYFLAMIRSEFFRLLLPLGVSRLLSTLSLLLAAAVTLYYGALCERSRTYRGIVPIAVSVWTMVDVIGYRLGEVNANSDPTGLYLSSALLLVVSGLLIGHSLRMVRRGAIA